MHKSRIDDFLHLADFLIEFVSHKHLYLHPHFSVTIAIWVIKMKWYLQIHICIT